MIVTLNLRRSWIYIFSGHCQEISNQGSSHCGYD